VKTLEKNTFNSTKQKETHHELIGMNQTTRKKRSFPKRNLKIEKTHFKFRNFFTKGDQKSKNSFKKKKTRRTRIDLP